MTTILCITTWVAMAGIPYLDTVGGGVKSKRNEMQSVVLGLFLKQLWYVELRTHADNKKKRNSN